MKSSSTGPFWNQLSLTVILRSVLVVCGEFTLIRVDCVGVALYSVDTVSTHPLRDNWSVIADHAAINVHVRVVV